MAFTLWLCCSKGFWDNKPSIGQDCVCSRGPLTGVCIQRTSVNSLYSLAVCVCVWGGVSVYRELLSTAFTLWLCVGCLYKENFRQQPLLSGCVGQRVLGRQAKYRGIMCMQSGSSDRCLYTENFRQQPLLSGCVGERVLRRQSKHRGIMCAYLQIFQKIFLRKHCPLLKCCINTHLNFCICVHCFSCHYLFSPCPW